MCSASFCHWVASSVMLLIFTLRRRLILGDGSLFSLLSRTPRDADASKSGLRGGEGPSGRSRGEQRDTLKTELMFRNPTRSSQSLHKLLFYQAFLRRH